MGEIAGLIAAFTWACTSVMMASLSARTSPVALSALRLGAATLALPLVLLFSGTTSEIADAPLLTILGIAASGFLGYGLGDTVYIRALNVLGMQITFPITMALFIGLTVLGGIVLLDEPMTFGLLGGAALVAYGASLLFSSSRRKTSEAEVQARAQGLAPSARPGWTAYALLPLVGLFWAVATLWLSAAKGDLSAIAVGTIRTPAGAIALLAFGLITQPANMRAPFASRMHIGTIVVAGLLGTLFGSLLYVYSVVEAGAAKAAVLSATAPLMALPLGVIFLGEPLGRRSVGGTACCVGGILLLTIF